MTTTKPDALDDLRDLLKTLHRAATPGECIQAHRILAALEAERLELRQAIIRVGGIALMEGHNFGSPLQEAIKDAMNLVSDDEDDDE